MYKNINVNRYGKYLIAEGGLIKLKSLILGTNWTNGGAVEVYFEDKFGNMHIIVATHTGHNDKDIVLNDIDIFGWAGASLYMEVVADVQVNLSVKYHRLDKTYEEWAGLPVNDFEEEEI